ncbi:MAG: hypothetical protein QM535_20280 [Limnohabitans sp.]|nr:hypothetical protein [Limnohabitans sp.]
MKKLFFIISSFFICSTNRNSAQLNPNNTQCSLPVYVSKNDTFDIEADMEYGIGDDDLFSANNFKLYRFDSGVLHDASDMLDDYNLTTAAKFKHKKSDTLFAIFSFPNIISSEKDTLAIIKSITIFNGNRKSMQKWKVSRKIRQLEFFHRGNILGCAELQNTFKYQNVNLLHNIYVHPKQSDTIIIVIKSIYSNTINKSNTYEISEIKIEGEKKY